MFRDARFPARSCPRSRIAQGNAHVFLAGQRRQNRLGILVQVQRWCLVAAVIVATSSMGSIAAGEDEPMPTPAVAEPKEASVAGVRTIVPRPCSFQQLTPGESRVEEVIERLGQPAEETEKRGEKILAFHQEPFSRIEVYVSNDLVTSIVLHLKQPGSSRQIAKELQLEELEPAQVTGDKGEILGSVYPERGLLLNYATASASSQVTQLILEPVTAEPFLLRVRSDTRHRYQRNLADLENALSLDPASAESLCRKAATLSAAGQATAALKAIDQALHLEPANDAFRLQRARLLAALERHDEAETIAKDLSAGESTSEVLKADAECLRGDLLSRGPARDHAAAIQHHLNAVKLATPWASGGDIELRRRAKAVLLDAFLGAAHDIAAGNWQRRPETTAKWLGSARELADAAVAQDGGDVMLPLRVQCATLQAQADLNSDVDPSQLLSSIQREIDRLAESSEDPLFEQTLSFLEAQALFDAASVEQGRGAQTKALEYAIQAAAVLDPIVDERELLPKERLLAGQLYFFVGSCHAVLHRNHDDAVHWYERARPYLTDTLPPSAKRDLGRHGERFVSMGASYWELEHRDEALNLTRRGLEMMQQAVKQGLLREKSLALPYGNLAAMYKLTGQSDDARNFAELAARISAADSSSSVRR